MGDNSLYSLIHFTNMFTKQSGYVLQRGPSPIDGSPIVVIMTTESQNRKTGNMLQVWILRDDVNPVEAIATGDDVSICGDCPHRKQSDGTRSCYVNPGQAPNSVYKAYKAGRYKLLWQNEELEAAVKGRRIRWGAYGDPACIDPTLVIWLSAAADSHTGYTHQWREPYAAAFKGVFMASCDNTLDFIDASLADWETFSVVPKGQKPAHIKQCPATIKGSKATCLTCSLCDGATTSIYVEAHGTGAKYVTATA